MNGMGARVIHVKPYFTKEHVQGCEGQYFDIESDWMVLDDHDENVTVVASDTETILCKILRHAIPMDLCQVAIESFKDVGKRVSTNRGTAAGMNHRERKDGSKYERGSPANSGIMGYIDSMRHNVPCRLTAFTREHFDKFQSGLPFIQAIDRCFEMSVPDAYEKQRTEAQKTNFHIQNTAFSTVTVNLDFQTSLHRDSGDFNLGFGNLVVCSDGIHGGHLLFPRYKIAVGLRTGDFLAMNVHEWHCNSPIIKEHMDAFRLSFVCYLRARMNRCAKINGRIDTMTGIKTDSESLCKMIFQVAGEEVHDKRVIGAGPTGIQWWQCESENYILSYRNKRYELYDKMEGTKIHNLWNALEYAITKHQRSSDDIASGRSVRFEDR